MLFDSHAHIYREHHNVSPEDIVENAKKEGVTHILNIGTSIKDNKYVIQTLDMFANVYGSVAIYPHEDKEIPLEKLRDNLLLQIKSHKKMVAVGECGVDISEWQNGRELNQQIELFEMQIQLAVDNKLPLIIHNRNGDEVILDILKNYRDKGIIGVFHCFSQDWEFAKKALDLGFYISFAGNITYPSNKRFYETIEKVPEDRFLVETDSPYLPPQGHRGEANEPKYVKIVAETVAMVRKDTFQNISDLSFSNTCALFKINL